LHKLQCPSKNKIGLSKGFTIQISPICVEQPKFF